MNIRIHTYHTYLHIYELVRCFGIWRIEQKTEGEENRDRKWKWLINDYIHMYCILPASVSLPLLSSEPKPRLPQWGTPKTPPTAYYCHPSPLKGPANTQWCERCLLITESPKTSGHYRYLIWVLVYIPYTGLAVFNFAISRVPVYTAISKFFKFVFSTLQSRSCWQLSNSCLLRGFEDLLLWIDILSILLPIWCIFEVVWWVFSTLNVLVRLSIPIL